MNTSDIISAIIDLHECHYELATQYSSGEDITLELDNLDRLINKLHDVADDGGDI